jgi:large subunit ribosomal protein L16
MAHSGATILFGDFALQAVEPAWITARQIEAARRAMVRYIVVVVGMDTYFP